MLKKYNIDSTMGIVEANSSSAQIYLYISPSEEEKIELLTDFSIDPYDLESAQDADEAARLEIDENRMFIVWKAPLDFGANGINEFNISSIGILYTEDRVIFIANEDQITFASREFRNAKTVTDVILAFLLHSIRHYVGHLRSMKQISSDLEDKVTSSMENHYLLQMFSMGESLVYYSDAIEGNSSTLHRLRNASAKFNFTEMNSDLLEDVILENKQASKQSHIYGSVLTGLMDARGSIINNNMNVLLKNLTLINIVFLPLNLIASIGGMSEWTMITQGMDWRLSYSLLTAIMSILGWITWMIMKKIIELNQKNTIKRAKKTIKNRP